ncbi:MAG TPA: CHAP domain-containing protein, partial [Ktedonobacteraceae bacterium]|nr:CHAP domain-containing protein [Ktedonobacteraceae bacterium]
MWWAWEQWHLLGYDLPRNWGNATDWAVDAAASGLPLGMTPRLGAIAVFPRGDGVWAYGPEGHVAFVTSVASDGMTFNVTYQNYGDPTSIYIGTNYNVDVINQPQFQAGLLRFIYFPRSIDAQLFSQLPGIGNGNLGDALNQANNALASTVNTGASVALGLSPGSSNQEFNADFTGTGSNDLLLYNRQQGTLSVLKLDQKPSPLGKFVSGDVTSNPGQAVRVPAATNVVNLGDSLTPVGAWGSSLDVHIGNFAGTSQSDILLYDRLTGKMQLLSLTPNLTIKQHVTINGLGPDWEAYTGHFNGQRSSVFLYNRYAQPQPISTTNPTSTSNQPRQPTPTPHPASTVKPTPTPSATSCSTTTASPTATATAASTSCATVTPTTIACPAATAAAGTPVACSTPTVGATATSTPTPTAGATATSTPTPTPGVTATSTP